MKLNSKPSRRSFLSQASLAIGATVIPGSLLASPYTNEYEKENQSKADETPHEVTLKQTGWNIASTRFIDAPTWTWEPFSGAVAYMVMVADENDKTAKTIRLSEPHYDMSKDWPTLDNGPLNMIVWAVNDKNEPLCAAWPNAATGKRFYKSPPFDGVAQKPMDYQASIEKSMQYMLAPARDQVASFEGDMPRSCWSACEESFTGQRRLVAFPALHHPSFILAYLEYAKLFPESKLSKLAIHQASQYGDWLLVNRLPANWYCSLFPFSTIENGKTEGHIEGKNITLFRAARAGEAMVALYKHFKDDKYLDYARHIANKFMEIQRPDGSWPYRVDPKNGKVVEEYTSNAVSPARLFGFLEEIKPDPAYTAARKKAADWVMKNPVANRLWQGMYEDVRGQLPYKNLQHWDTNEMIRYLVHYESDVPSTVKITEDLNHYIEDQFVIWKSGDRVIGDQCPAPLVLEQYACYRPMECHTGNWLRSLLALHRATGKNEYLVKAINAGNAIVKSQSPNGAFSTWGFDPRFGRPMLTIDWPGCNAVAISALLELDRYIKSPAANRVQQL